VHQKSVAHATTLTYMAIRDEINRHCSRTAPKLFCLSPLVRSTLVMRTLFVSVEVNDVIYPPWPPNRNGYRLSKFRAVLDDFLAGGRVSVAENPFKKPSDALLARVCPTTDDVWDIRCIDPKPGIRCLGCFSEKDTFVALTWNYREDFCPEDWATEIGRCKTEWSSLFNPHRPFHGAHLDEYLSINYHAV
jgi:hypothetical protein